jgi:hypothetical protein
MNNMRLGLTGFATGVALALGLSVFPSQAILIDLTKFVTPPRNDGEATIENWVGQLVTAYDTANNPDLPVPGLEDFRVGNDAPVGWPSIKSGVKDITLPTGQYDYVVLHWGGGADVLQAFYIGSIGGAPEPTYEFKSPNGKGLSWYDAFHQEPQKDPQIPDGGNSMILLGLTFLGLTGMAWKMGRA